MYNHVKKLLSVGFFQSNKEKHPTPITIDQNVEYLEILTAGEIIYPENSSLDNIYKRGTIFWHKKGEKTISHFLPGKPYSCYTILFEVDQETRPAPKITTPKDSENLIEFLQEAFNRFHSENISSKEECFYLYSTLAWYASRSHDTLTTVPKVLEKALSFMENNLTKNISCYDIAKSVQISEPYLFALMKRYYNTSPHQKLKELRLILAKQLLAGSNTPIKEIAFECGFATMEGFHRTFKKETNLTPYQYRAKFNINIDNI